MVFITDLKEAGYVALAIGGALLLFDRCFGLTSAWVRFITAATSIQKLLTEYNTDYLELCHTKKNRCEEQIKCIKKFLHDVREEIVKESAAWAGEYSTNLEMLEGLSNKKSGGNK